MTEIKKPLRRVAAGTIWHFFDGVKVNGPHHKITGHVTRITGDVSGIRDNVTGITGDVSLIPESARPCAIAAWVRD